MENSMVLDVNYNNLLNDLNYEQMVALQEEIKERKMILQFDKRISGIESYNKQLEKELERVTLKLEDSEEKINTMDKNFNNLKEKTSLITDTLISHAIEKRALEKHIHSLIYKCIKKGTLRDELFHGTLTSSCKKHINTSLQVAKFDCIMVADVETAKRLASKHLTEYNIHSIMRKDAKRLFDKSQLSKQDNVKRLGYGMGRKFELLEKLLSEVGGDIDEI